METALKKNELIAKLQSEILSMQGFQPSVLGAKRNGLGLGRINNAFPGGIFPIGAIHEFISDAPEASAATTGFMAALAGQMMKQDGICLWVAAKRTVYPLALNYFGLAPDRVIFIDVKREKDLLWVIEEALRCDALAAVVGEVRELSLTESRRLQLAVEKSKVTGMLHRVNPRIAPAVAAACRWRITPMSGEPEDVLPGIGYPSWEVTIERVRNGEPGSWQLQWQDDHFVHLPAGQRMEKEHLLNVG